MTRWIIEKSQGLTDVGLLRISESVSAYAYLILDSQASVRSRIVGNTASALACEQGGERKGKKEERRKREACRNTPIFQL